MTTLPYNWGENGSQGPLSDLTHFMFRFWTVFSAVSNLDYVNE